LNRVANIYSVDNRLRAQRVAPRALPAFPRIPAPREISRELIGTRTEVRQRGGVIPSWVIFATIIAATFAIAVSVNVRSHLELKNATLQFQAVNTEVSAMREANNSMAREVQLLEQSDPATIEACARLQLGMARPNEIVMPVETR
jgi:cell division protein FtsB